MARESASDPARDDHSQWSEALNVILRLNAARNAGARSATLHRNGAIDPAVKGSAARPYPPAPPVAIENSELERSVAEIRKAAEALRRTEPALEAGSPATGHPADIRTSNSVWVLVISIWVSTAIMAGLVFTAIMALVG